MAQGMGHALQSRLFYIANQPRIDADPPACRVQRLLGQVDGAAADVLVGVEADLLEHGRQRGELHLAVRARQRPAVGAAEGVEHFDPG